MWNMDHPACVRVIEAFKDEKAYYMVMERVFDSKTLHKHILEMDEAGKGYFSEKEAASITNQLLGFVLHCRHHKYAHRDLNPNNILMYKNKNEDHYSIKIIGFESTIKQKPMVSFSELLGTPMYIAPEVYTGNYDRRCDLWSLGAIVHCILTGWPPIYGESPKEIENKSKTWRFDE